MTVWHYTLGKLPAYNYSGSPPRGTRVSFAFTEFKNPTPNTFVSATFWSISQVTKYRSPINGIDQVETRYSSVCLIEFSHKIYQVRSDNNRNCQLTVLCTKALEKHFDLQFQCIIYPLISLFSYKMMQLMLIFYSKLHISFADV